MTDEELIETLWSGEVTLGVVASAADRIEQLVKDVNETHKEAMAWIEKWGAALKSQREAEAKLAKAVDIIKQIIATAHADDYFAWDTALDDGIDFIAELEKTE